LYRKKEIYASFTINQYFYDGGDIADQRTVIDTIEARGYTPRAVCNAEMIFIDNRRNAND